MIATSRKPKTEFGRRLKSLMLDKGWNQSELARRAEMGRDNVSGYIHGKYLPNSKHLHKLAHALGVDPGSLLPDEGGLPAPKFDDGYLEIKHVPGQPGVVSVRISRTLPTAVALEVVKLIEKAGNA